MVARRRCLMVSGAAVFFLGCPSPRVLAQLNCTENCLPTIALVPTGAIGNYRLEGNEITVSEGAVIYVEIHIAHWDFDQDAVPLLLGYQATIDASSFSSGSQGSLIPFELACEDTITCIYQIAKSAGECTDGRCPAGFIGTGREDWILELSGSPEVDLSVPDFRYTAARSLGGVVDDGTPGYAGTLLLEVPPDTSGTFTIRLSKSPEDTYLLDTEGNPIGPLFFGDARITVVPDKELFFRAHRFLPIKTGRPPGRRDAVRVKFRDLKGKLATLNGTTMWVGEPRKLSTNGGRGILDSVSPGEPFIWVAPLVCRPLYMDWLTRTEPIHVYGDLIGPGTSYDIQLVPDIFPNSDDVFFTPPYVVWTSPWGDVSGPFDVENQVWSAADGSVDIVSDAIATLSRFQNLTSAPQKTRVDLAPSPADGVIDIVDIVMVVNAFQGLGDPFVPTVPEPCP